MEGFGGLMTQSEHDALKELIPLIKRIKPKYFSLGRDLTRFEELMDIIGGKNAGTDKKVHG